ncbi:transcription factor HES-5-like isoform X2 [Spea bombifrons]|nr:transcription factor HES-5-like isoform X2 [Spea bombifrons]
MRRDRINGCIDQLRIILEKEFQKNHPHSKLEKADILEMAVSYLQQQKQQTRDVPSHQENRQDSYYQGYYMCLRETVGFLNKQESQSVKVEMLNHFTMEKNPARTEKRQASSNQTVSRLGGASCQISHCTKEIWRPW